MNASVLVGSLMASHTLLGLPVIKELGLIKNEAVIVTVGATIFTDIASMLVLAICLSIHSTGFSTQHLLAFLGELAIYIPVVVFGLSWVAKKLFEFTKSEELRLGILLLLIAVASNLAEMIELEGIIGAFLAGLAANRLPPSRALTGGAAGLVVGIGGYIAAIAVGSFAVYLVGAVIAGAGFGVAFAGAMRVLLDRSPEGAHAGTLAAVYLFCYLAAAVSSLLAGVAVEFWGLAPVATVLCSLVIAMVAGGALGSALRLRTA